MYLLAKLLFFGLIICRLQYTATVSSRWDGVSRVGALEVTTKNHPKWGGC